MHKTAGVMFVVSPVLFRECWWGANLRNLAGQHTISLAPVLREQLKTTIADCC